MGLRRGRRAGEYAEKQGGESAQRECQTPTARGQTDRGVNHKHRRGNRTGAGADPKECDLTPADGFDDGGVNVSLGSEASLQDSGCPTQEQDQRARK